MRLHALAIGSIALVACPAPGIRPAAGPWHVVRIDTLAVAENYTFGFRILRFQNGRDLTLPLTDVAVLGSLPRPAQAPLLVLGARGCAQCDAELMVFVLPADGDSIKPLPGSFSYPGTHQEPSGPPFYEARLFLGECRMEGQPVGLWFQRERDTLGVWQASVYEVQTDPGGAVGTFLSPPPDTAAVLARVASGKCVEVPGLVQDIF